MKFDKFINESTINVTDDDKSIWDVYGEKLPSIFKSTIYRMATDKELEEVNSYKLPCDAISQGFGYTIVGRGMYWQKQKDLIIKCISRLCELYPDNKEYKSALQKAQEKKPRSSI